MIKLSGSKTLVFIRIVLLTHFLITNLPKKLMKCLLKFGQIQNSKMEINRKYSLITKWIVSRISQLIQNLILLTLGSNVTVSVKVVVKYLV